MKQKKDPLAGGSKDKNVESSLISRLYHRPAVKSSHRVESVPMTPIDLQNLFLRFQVGRQTTKDAGDFRFFPGMTIGQFVDANGIDVVSA